MGAVCKVVCPWAGLGLYLKVGRVCVCQLDLNVVDLKVHCAMSWLYWSVLGCVWGGWVSVWQLELDLSVGGLEIHSAMSWLYWSVGLFKHTLCLPHALSSILHIAVLP